MQTELTIDQAKDILAHVVSQKERWGQQYDAGDIGLSGLMDALIVIAKEDNETYTSLRAQLTKANRALGASNARETKLKNEIKKLSDGK